MLADTHCHIHSKDYGLNGDETIERAVEAGVGKLICVGTSIADSELAVEFVSARGHCWSAIGMHPHYAKDFDSKAREKFAKLLSRQGKTAEKVLAIGETGLDYYYEHSPPELQKETFIFQLEKAKEHNLPLIFHVREAFEDFWPIVDEFKGIKGVIHSFSATKKEVKEGLKRDFYFGLNGIMTFSKDQRQLDAAKAIPIEKLVLETDSPFLTPTPFRGRINEPKYVVEVAKFLARLRGETYDIIANSTTQNVKELFGI